MSAVLLDTHAWAWSLTGYERLSKTAASAILQAESVYVSPISFYEIGQKVRFGKWPQMETYVTQLQSLLQRQGGMVSTLSSEICLRAATLEWTHRDPFDRLLAATAQDQGIPIVSADVAFDSVAGVTRLW